MNITITSADLGGTVAAIPSKSAAHRLLICAALSDGVTRVACPETSADIDATVRCLTALGAVIEYANAVFTVMPLKRPILGHRTLDVGESGSTFRFMLPIACALGADADFVMGGRLPVRPLSPLYEELAAHGCTLSPQGSNPFHISGQLQSGRFTIRGDVSSQFISGLLFALPLLEGASEIKVTGTLESKPYVDMTLEALHQYGVSPKQEGAAYIIPGHSRYYGYSEAAVEGDWSNAAFWLCAGALGKQTITMTNLKPDSLQGDKAVLPILERFCARVIRNIDSVTVARGELRGIDIDAGDTPDLVPVLAAVACAAEGETVIRNASRLRIKESDRLQTVTETLSALGADITATPDGLVIHGKPRLKCGTINAHGDHRIAMMAAVAAAICDGPVTIVGAEAVQKSYPGFFRDFTALGGTIEEVS